MYAIRRTELQQDKQVWKNIATFKNHKEKMVEQKYKKVTADMKPPKVDLDEDSTENKETLKKSDEKKNDKKLHEPEVKKKKILRQNYSKIIKII